MPVLLASYLLFSYIMKLRSRSRKKFRKPSASAGIRLLPEAKEDEFMIEGLLQPSHLLIILAIALFVFGPKKLPELGQGLGKGIRSFKDSMKAATEEPEKIDTTSTTRTPDSK